MVPSKKSVMKIVPSTESHPLLGKYNKFGWFLLLKIGKTKIGENLNWGKLKWGKTEKGKTKMEENQNRGKPK